MSESKAGSAAADKMRREGPPDPTWPVCPIRGCALPSDPDCLALGGPPLCGLHADDHTLVEAVRGRGVECSGHESVMQYLAIRLEKRLQPGQLPATPPALCERALEHAARMTTWVPGSGFELDDDQADSLIHRTRWDLATAIRWVREYPGLKLDESVTDAELHDAIVAFQTDCRSRLQSRLLQRKSPSGRPRGAVTRKGAEDSEPTPGTEAARRAAVAKLLQIKPNSVRTGKQRERNK